MTSVMKTPPKISHLSQNKRFIVTLKVLCNLTHVFPWTSSCISLPLQSCCLKHTDILAGPQTIHKGSNYKVLAFVVCIAWNASSKIYTWLPLLPQIFGRMLPSQWWLSSLLWSYKSSKKEYIGECLHNLRVQKTP